MTQIAGKTEPDPKTGWWREDVWEGDDGGMFGDDDEDRRWLVGTPYSVEYTDGVYKCRVYYSPVGIRDADEPEVVRYSVDGASEFWKIKLNEHGDDEGNDSAVTDYDLGSALYYATEEQAQREARRYALNDESYAFNSPKLDPDGNKLNEPCDCANGPTYHERTGWCVRES